MTFCSKLGGTLRQSVFPSSPSPMMSMLNSIRTMSSNKIFVGGLSFGTDDGSLKDAFSSFGEVVESRVIVDRDTGRSRGFGFISYADEESASSALSAMDGKELQGRTVRVSYATQRAPRTSGSGGNYGVAGDY